jgi:hypothetical protein
VGLGEPGGDAGAQVSAVRRVVLEAEFVVRQPVPEVVRLLRVAEDGPLG